MTVGLILGLLLGLGVLAGIAFPGMPWLVTVGLVKITFVGALGLVAGGAVLLRLAKRNTGRIDATKTPEITDG